LEAKNIKKWIISIILVGVIVGATLNHSIATSNIQRHITIELSSLDDTQCINMTVSEADAREIKEILDGVDGRLQNATNTEEKYQVYISTVSQLYQYGVFGNLTLLQAQQLVTYWYQVGLHYHKDANEQYSINKNALCLVSGHTGYTYTGHRFTNWMLAGGWIMLVIGFTLFWPPYNPPYTVKGSFHPLLGLLLAAIGIVTFSFGTALAYRGDMTPIAIIDIFGIGFYYGTPNDVWYAPGWVHTLGVFGNKNWSGEIKGNLPGTFPYSLIIITYQAIWGFCGIKVWLNEDGSEKSYLGSALLVGLDKKS
jgi:hypothetical protein